MQDSWSKYDCLGGVRELSRYEDEDEETYEQPAHHCPEDHGNCAVCHGAASGIALSRDAENRCGEYDRGGGE